MGFGTFLWSMLFASEEMVPITGLIQLTVSGACLMSPNKLKMPLNHFNVIYKLIIYLINFVILEIWITLFNYNIKMFFVTYAVPTNLNSAYTVASPNKKGRFK